MNQNANSEVGRKSFFCQTEKVLCKWKGSWKIKFYVKIVLERLVNKTFKGVKNKYGEMTLQKLIMNFLNHDK